jgi:hypothetical protein
VNEIISTNNTRGRQLLSEREDVEITKQSHMNMHVGARGFVAGDATTSIIIRRSIYYSMEI